MPAGGNRQDRLQFYSWLLFLACSLFFLGESVVEGSPLMMAAGVLFFLGCVVALLPWVRGRHR